MRSRFGAAGFCSSIWKVFDLSWPSTPSCQQLPGYGKLSRVFLVASIGRPFGQASGTLVCTTGNWQRGTACPYKKTIVIPKLVLCDLVFTSIYSSASVGSQQSQAFLPLAFGIFLCVTMAPLVAETPAFETCLRNGVSVQCLNTLISISIGE